MASITDRSSSLLTQIRKSVAGSVEDDTFLINDVLLTIPPTQIQVEKQTFDYSWQTLRTTNSTTIKSGHSQVRVSVSVVFKDLDTLAKLWAGFRACPFCSVYNPYLSDKINSIEPNADSYNQYKVLQPVVLALASATFSTMGHEGLVDCIQGQLEFVYFNYHPYTPIFAYKTGPDNNVPGPAWESTIWQAFYSPFISKSIPRYPNFDPAKFATRFEVLEFTSRPYGTKDGMTGAKELVNTLKNRPDAFIQTLSQTLKEKGVDKTNLYDAIHKKLLSSGVLSTDRSSIYTPDNDTTITKSGSAVLDPLLQKVMAMQMKAGSNPIADAVGDARTLLEDAAAELKRRADILQQAEDTEGTDPGWNLVAKADSSLSTSGNTYGLGGFKLYSRPRALTCSPSNGFVVEQITISMRNILAMVPMAGYTYPTIQHIGSNDVVVMFSLNATNAAAGKLHRLYDLVENTNLYFKRVPAGVRTLRVSNDFLDIFGYKEFQVTGLSSSTIPNQPGRTSLTFELAQSGVDLASSFSDPEVIKQEFIPSSERARREVWNVMGKYLTRDYTRPAGNSIDLFIKQEIIGITSDKRSYAFYKLLEQARDTYNEMVKSVFNYFFVGQTSGTIGVGGPTVKLRDPLPYTLRASRQKEFQQLLNLPESTYGWTPLMSELKDVLRQYGRVVTMSGGAPAVSNSSKEGLEKKVFGDTTEKRGYRDPSTIELQNHLQAMKFLDYQKAMFKLLDSIIYGQLHLDQFKSLRDMVKDAGIMRGTMAYPDFAPQLAAIASYSSEGKKTDDVALLAYEPDAYLWYPYYAAINNSTDITRIIDPSLISIAKEQSLRSFDTAQGSVDDFFQNTYLAMMKNAPDFDAERKGKSPYKVLSENVGKNGGGITQTLYNKVSFGNSSVSEEIKHLVIPDPAKLQTNWPKQRGDQIKSEYSLLHSTDLHQLWDGVESTCGEGLGDDETQQSKKKTNGYQPHEVPITGPASDLGVESRSFNTTWEKSTQTPSPQGFVCPVKSYSLTHSCLLVRDIWHKAETSGDTSSFRWRVGSVKLDWDESPSVLQAAGAISPYVAEKSGLGPVGTWTVESYAAWKKKTRKWVGYVHKGIDANCNVGTDVYAIADGTIRTLYQTPMKGAGIFVEITHTNGMTSRYMHLQQINPKLKRGDKVKAGDCIAISGRSGQRKMGAHLHFEVYSKFVGFRKPGNKLESPNKIGIPWQSKPTKKGRAAAKRTEIPKEGPVADKLVASATAKVPSDVTSTMSSPLVESIKAFESDVLRGQGQSLLRAYPTFKLYFIEDDMDERRRLAFDDFFSYSAVKSIRAIRNKDIPADLVVIELTNISGVLSNRKFKQDENKPGIGPNQYRSTGQDKPKTASGETSKESILPADANTNKENPIASLMLQEGVQIHLRLGYSSDPDRLVPVFTGKITNIEFSESEDLVQIVAQSYAVELVQDIKGLENPEVKNTPWWSFWGFRDNATTGRVLEEMMASPELVHFGRWDPAANGTANRELLTNKWQFKPQPSDDNIFAPDPSTELKNMGNGLVFKDITYSIYRTTIWDIFQEMTMRHPNFIAAPVPYKDKYGERMTMFFGLPNQLYFSRHPTAEENVAQEKIKDEERQARARIMMLDPTVSTIMGASNLNPAAALNTKVAMALGANPALLASMYYQAKQKFGGDTLTEALKIVEESTRNSFRIKRLEEAKKAGYIAPFRKYHLLTSRHHIVSNNIQTNSRDVANTVFIMYNDKIDASGTASIANNMVNPAQLMLKVDNALPQEDVKVQYCASPNVTNDDLAKRYAISTLKKSLQKGYKGEIVIIGNPSIKPYDVCFVLDEANDMSGPIEVRQVVHLLNQDNGFLTEIQPDMLISAADWSLLTTCEAMGLVVNGAARKLFGDQAANITLPSSKLGNAALGAVAIGLGANMWNCFLNDKVISYTQLGQPLVIAPLVHHGRPFAGGIPVRKLPMNIWRTIFGKWYNEADAVYSDWMEDIWEGVKNTAKTLTGQHTTGSFIGGFRTNTLEVD